MPQDGTVLKFEGWDKTVAHPFVVYADFEALLEKCAEAKGENTIIIHKHRPMSYGYYVKAADYVPTDLLEKYDIPSFS